MKNKTWIRFLKTYISFILCSIMITVPSYIRYFSILQENERNISSEVISNGLDMVDNQIMSLISLSQTTYADTRYRVLADLDPEIPLSNVVTLGQIQSNFRSLIGTQNLVSDAGIFLRNGIFFTRYRSYFNTQNHFYDSFFNYNDLDENGWKKLLNSNAKGGFLPAAKIISADYGTYDGITYICTWPTNYPNNYAGILYATVKTSDILSQLVSEDVLEDGYVLLYDSEDNLLIDYQHDKSSDKKFQVISYKSSNFKVEVGISDSLIAEHLKPIHNLLLIYLLGMTVVSLLLASFFAYRNSNPIRKLVSTVNRINNIPTQQSGNLNEYDFIANTVTSLDQKVDTFAHTIESQKDIIRVHLFEKAINEGLHSKNIQSEFEKAFPTFPKRYQLATLNFTIRGDKIVETIVSLNEEIVDQLSGSIYIQSYGDRTIILLLPSTDATPEDYWEKSLKELQKVLIDKYDLDFHISLSEQFEDQKRLPEAYSQIRSIDLLADRQNSASVWQLKDFPKHSPNLSLDFSSMQQFYDALHLGDLEATKSILDSNLQSIHSTGYVDEVIIKQVFYNFRNILLRVKLENYEYMNSIEIPIYEQSANIQKLFDDLYNCCEEICSYTRKLRENSKAKFSDSVIDFIRNNYTNGDLYAKMVANEFSISETTLQKIVQTSVGKTFFEYVEDLRLEKAYHLLKSTSFTVSHIASESGFASQNSFYKAFKRRYHQSPGSIRQ